MNKAITNSVNPITNSVHPRSKARVTDSIADRDRRSLLKLAMAQGIAAPFAIAAFEQPAYAKVGEVQPKPEPSVQKGRMRRTDGLDGNLHASGAIVRDFVDPYLELLRLLREAAEIEHALMLQYLYCAFSLKETYADLAGHGSADANNMLGVAIQEMQHLGAVNKLLVALGSCPHLDRQDFPYEPDIYPFVFQLEPLSRASLAKYVFVEGAPDTFDLALAKTKEDKAFAMKVRAEHTNVHKSNHIGSLYQSVLDMLSEVANQPNAPISKDEAAQWKEELVRIMEEGEDDHFNFFKVTFEAKHDAFRGNSNAWDLPRSDPAYPSHNLQHNPTAYIGHPNQIESLPALVLAWLGNLHYWITLSTLDLAYRTDDDGAVDVAMMQMMSNLWPIARTLPQFGTGITFDPLSMGYALGAAPDQTKRVIASFGKEALNFSATIQHHLPDNYDASVTQDLIDYMSA